MGRTVPSMTQQILMELQSWGQFRRALRVEEREVFDELFRSVRMHVAEVSMAARLLPFEAMLMSMLVSQGVRLRQVEQQLTQLQTGGGQVSEGRLRGQEQLRGQQVLEETTVLTLPHFPV